MERDSSDEDDDRETLIHQNETKNQHQHRSSTFDIQQQHHSSTPPRSPPSQRRHNFLLFLKNLNKTYVSLLFLPLLILLIFLFLFSPHLRLNVPSIRFDSLTDQMRESELRALSLLKQQHSILLSLFNQSLSNSTSSTLSLLHLNTQIQQTLLSPHKVANFSVDDDKHFPANLCPKKHEGASHDENRQTVEWNPKQDKFLFAICLSGQMSNHLICLEKHMFFAALMGRVLVIPSHKFDFQYSKVLDIDHINDCLGRKVVVTFDEFEKMRKNHAHIDRFLCYFSTPQPCYVDDEHIKKLKQQLGVSVGKIETVWKEDIKKPSRKTAKDVQAKFMVDDDVIAIGDVFFANVEGEMAAQPGGPIAHKCKTLIEPSRLILLTAQRFVQTFLGDNFIALHFRRHGFLKFCNAKKPSCFYPIPQAAECINRIIERTDAPVIYLSTDAAESETNLLQSLVGFDGKVVPLVKRPPRNSAEKWDALLYRHSLEDDSQVEAMLDKSICAMSNVFVGAPGSTFTEDILRLRKDWRLASACDQYLCQGEEPNFIAEDE